jgi:putative MATE family efflux protein
LSGRRARHLLRRWAGRPKGAWALAAPVVVQELALVLAGAIVTLLAARLGPSAVAAIGMVDALGYLLHALFGAMAVGATVTVAHTLGAGRREALHPVACSALALAGLGALALSVLLWFTRSWWLAMLLPGVEPAVSERADTYFRWLIVADVPTGAVLVGCGVMRGMGRTAAAMRVQLAMNAVHVGLGWLLMHQAGWDVDGAGAALLAGRGLGLLWVLHTMTPLLRRPRAGPDAPGPPLQWRHVRAIVRVGWPTAVETGFFHVGKLVTQTLVAGLGTSAMAANFIAFSISALLNIPGAALGVAATTLVGLRLGAGRRDGARVALRRVGTSATVSLSLLALGVAPLAPLLAGLYGSGPEVTAQAARLIVLNCLFMPVWAAAFVLPAGLRGAGDTRYTMGVAIAGMWLFRVVLGYLLGRLLGLGVAGVWLGMFIDWCVRGLLFWRRVRDGGWTKHRILD